MAVRTLAAILREIDGVERGVRNRHIDKADGDAAIAMLRLEIKELSSQRVLDLAPRAAAPEPSAATPTAAPPGKRS